MLEPEGPAPGSWRPQAAELEWGGERRGDVEGARLAPVAHRTSGTGAAVLQGVVGWRAPWPLCACSLHWIRWSRQTRAPDDWGLSAPTRRKPHAARGTPHVWRLGVFLAPIEEPMSKPTEATQESRIRYQPAGGGPPRRPGQGASFTLAPTQQPRFSIRIVLRADRAPDTTRCQGIDRIVVAPVGLTLIHLLHPWPPWP